MSWSYLTSVTFVFWSCQDITQSVAIRLIFRHTVSALSGRGWPMSFFHSHFSDFMGRVAEFYPEFKVLYCKTHDCNMYWKFIAIWVFNQEISIRCWFLMTFWWNCLLRHFIMNNLGFLFQSFTNVYMSLIIRLWQRDCGYGGRNHRPSSLSISDPSSSSTFKFSNCLNGWFGKMKSLTEWGMLQGEEEKTILN